MLNLETREQQKSCIGIIQSYIQGERTETGLVYKWSVSRGAYSSVTELWEQQNKICMAELKWCESHI